MSNKKTVDGVHFYKCDLTDTSALESACSTIKQAHGPATVLINNAGIGTGKTVLEVCQLTQLLSSPT